MSMIQQYGDLRAKEISDKILNDVDAMIRDAIVEQERIKKEKEEERLAIERDNREWDELFAEIKEAESQLSAAELQRQEDNMLYYEDQR